MQKACLRLRTFAYEITVHGDRVVHIGKRSVVLCAIPHIESLEVTTCPDDDGLDDDGEIDICVLRTISGREYVVAISPLEDVYVARDDITHLINEYYDALIPRSSVI